LFAQFEKISKHNIMQHKLQDLTEKIYQEGIVKAKEQADAILAKAHAEAADLVAKAQKQADAVLIASQKQAEEAKRNLEAELKMTTLQALSTVKQQITDLVTVKVVNAPVEALFSNVAFLQKLVSTLVAGFAQSGQLDMKVVLPEALQSEMDQFFKNSLTAELNKGLVVEYSKQLNAGFKVGPKDNSYVVGFSDQDFVNFFKTFLRPKAAQFLFEGN
jgi:V/A-type H+/Na+-transporting ATPase subunit E